MIDLDRTVAEGVELTPESNNFWRYPMSVERVTARIEPSVDFDGDPVPEVVVDLPDWVKDGMTLLLIPESEVHYSDDPGTPDGPYFWWVSE